MLSFVICLKTKCSLAHKNELLFMLEVTMLYLLQALSRVTPSGLQSATPRWNPAIHLCTMEAWICTTCSARTLTHTHKHKTHIKDYLTQRTADFLHKSQPALFALNRGRVAQPQFLCACVCVCVCVCVWERQRERESEREKERNGWVEHSLVVLTSLQK